VAPDRARVDRRHGLRLDSDDVELHRTQIATALKEFRGFCLFAYSSLFDSPNDELDSQTEETRTKRQARRAAMLPVLKALASSGGEAE
jgi:hypothetical protein